MTRKNCQSRSMNLDSLTTYHSLTIDLSCILLPGTLKDLDLSCLNFYLYYLESELFYSSLSDTAFYRSSKKNFGHSIRYAKSYADLNSNSISFQNKRENNLVCLSFMDKIKSQIFTLKIKKTDENKEVNYVQSV